MRERSRYYVDAVEAFSKIAEGSRFDFSRVMDCFEKWLAVYQNGRYVRLVSRSDNTDYLFIRMFNRFQADYRAVVRKKLAFLHFVKFRTFLTLTVDPKKFMRLRDEFSFVSKAWAKLRQAMGRHGRFFYLRVLEVTSHGRPHLHILTNLAFIDIRVVRKLWVKYGGGVICKVRRCGSINGLSYLLKYVSKSMYNAFNSSSAKNDASRAGERAKCGSAGLFGALLFASNRRLYSFNDVRTRSSILDVHQLSKCDSESRYIYTGTVTLAELKQFCDEEEIVLDDVMWIEGSVLRCLDWKGLFGVGDF